MLNNFNINKDKTAILTGFLSPKLLKSLQRKKKPFGELNQRAEQVFSKALDSGYNTFFCLDWGEYEFCAYIMLEVILDRKDIMYIGIWDGTQDKAPGKRMGRYCQTILLPTNVDPTLDAEGVYKMLLNHSSLVIAYNEEKNAQVASRIEIAKSNGSEIVVIG
mgnify:CR=1 FL=1